MNMYSKKPLLGVVAVAAMLTVPVLEGKVSAAGPSLGFPAGKPYYGASNQRGSQSRMRSRPMYRSSESVVVRSERAPEAVAQAPGERRNYSYDPSQDTVSGSCSCGGTAMTHEAPATAERATETRRSYSYEPSTSSDENSVRSYSAPRMRSSRSSQTPLYLLPKSDPRKYGSH